MNREIYINYLHFIKEVGFSMSNLYGKASIFALTVENALYAIVLLKDSQLPIIGGDIVSKDKKGNFFYAYQLWNEGYHYLNWCCDKKNEEKYEDYIDRSYKIAIQTIIEANNIATLLKKQCYVVLMI